MERYEARDSPSSEWCSITRARFGDVELALLSRDVEEVTAVSAVTPIPCAPPHVPGIVALRGEAIPVFDLASFLGLSTAAPAEVPRMLIVRSRQYRVAVVCDQVLGVADVARGAMREAAVAGNPALRRYASAELDLGGSVVPLLDLEALLAAGRAR